MSDTGPRQLPGAAPRRAVPRLALVSLVCVGLGGWLSLPRAHTDAGPDAPPAHVVLVDASASATRGRASWPRFVRQRLAAECARAAERGADLAVVRFAGDVVVDHPPGDAARFREWLEGRGREPWPPVLEPARQNATELAGALEVAAGIAADPLRAPGEVVVLSDGTYTGEDPRAALEALALTPGRLARFEVFELPPPGRPDVALAELRVPDRVEEGAPLAVLATLTLEHGASDVRRVALSLALVREGVEHARIRRTSRSPSRPPSASVGEGAPVVTWTERLVLPAVPRGRYVLRAEVELEESGAADPIPENDALAREVTVGDPLTCLVLARDDRRAELGGLLRGPAFEGIVFEPTSFLDLAPGLARADVLLTESIGPGELPRAALADFLRSGGGWVSLAGYGALRGWEREDTGTPSDWLPLAPGDTDAEEREVTLLVDGSGSMTGDPFDKVRRAVFELVLGARPTDRFRLRFFTGAMEPIVFETHGARPEDLRRDLAPLFDAKVPRGPTDVLYALGQLAVEREASGRRGLVLLVTDGRTLDWRAERSQELRQRLVDSATELAVIAIGDAVDRAFLESLLLEGEVLEDATDLDRLRSVFQRRVHARETEQRSEARAAALDPAALSGSSASVGAEVLRAQLEGVVPPAGDLGPLVRSLRSELRPGAELLWRTDAGAPLLALTRAGGGLVASCATTPVEGWAPFLAERAGLLAPLLRAVGRGRDRFDGLRLHEEPGGLVLEGLDAGASVSIEARFLARSRGGGPGEWLAALDPERALGVEERELGRVRLEPPAEGHGADPRTVRTAPRPAFLDRVPPGAWLAVELGPGGAAGGLGRLYLTPRVRPELSASDRRRVAWPRGSPTAEGRPAAGPEGPGGSEGPPRSHPAAPWLLALGLGVGSLAALRPRRGNRVVKETGGSPERVRGAGLEPRPRP